MSTEVTKLVSLYVNLQKKKYNIEAQLSAVKKDLMKFRKEPIIKEINSEGRMSNISKEERDRILEDLFK